MCKKYISLKIGIAIILSFLLKSCQNCSNEFYFHSNSFEITKLSEKVKCIKDTLSIEKTDTLGKNDSLFIFFNPSFKKRQECEGSKISFFPENDWIVPDNDSLLSIEFYMVYNKTKVFLPISRIDTVYRDYCYFFINDNPDYMHYQNQPNPDLYRYLYNSYIDGSGDFYLNLFIEDIYKLELDEKFFNNQSVKFSSKLVFREKGSFLYSHYYFLKK